MCGGPVTYWSSFLTVFMALPCRLEGHRSEPTRAVDNTATVAGPHDLCSDVDVIFVLASGERDRTGRKSFLSLQGLRATLAPSRWTAHSQSLFLPHGLCKLSCSVSRQPLHGLV